MIIDWEHRDENTTTLRNCEHKGAMPMPYWEDNLTLLH